ncbi:hypothetical protein [Actinosynnema sp. ALI-1.44]|uniref:hypothetical protein n=1 Tax=Actinosynnema sp. ALI-1.44 TaxID=1933779 RepID=UPI00143CFD49|nr:hypothetical protein [Actinosynnema sp. ALI-1.44]
MDPTNISALAAADLDTRHQTVLYSSEGYMAVYAIGRMALMVVSAAWPTTSSR